jgi:hypothetical protein
MPVSVRDFILIIPWDRLDRLHFDVSHKLLPVPSEDRSAGRTSSGGRPNAFAADGRLVTLVHLERDR